MKIITKNKILNKISRNKKNKKNNKQRKITQKMKIVK